MYSQEVYKICGELKVRPEVAADILCVRMHQKPEVSVPKRTICGCSRYKAMHDHSEGCPDWQKPILFENGSLGNILPNNEYVYASSRPLQEVDLLEKAIEPFIRRANINSQNCRVTRDCDNVGSTTWNDWHLNLNGECPSCGYQNGDFNKKEQFKYTELFAKEKNPVYENQKLTLLLAEVVKFTEEYRLIRNKEYMRLKVLEELGEYSVATLGDKVVTETPRQELVDVLITTLSLFILEGGNLKMLADYGMFKLEKAKDKIRAKDNLKGE